MTNAEKLTLAKHACHIRMGVIEGTHSAKCGHPGGLGIRVVSSAWKRSCRGLLGVRNYVLH